jgi:hypothetical protein
MIVDLAKEHDLFVIGDEAYREFVYAGEPLLSMGEFADAADNVILADTVSKRFSACGARIGCIISRNHEFLGHAMKYCQSRLSVATLDQVASAALYNVGPEYFAAVRTEYKKRRDTVMECLAKIPGVICKCPRGAFYIMAALPVDDSDKFQRWLLEEFEDNGDTVMFAPGEPFYKTPGKGRNEIRIAYVLKQEDLEISVNQLRKRVSMPALSMADANAHPDPFLTDPAYGGYQSTVLAGDANKGVILEIRRERGVELCQEGFRYYDVMRWKEGKMFEAPFYGMYFPAEGVYDVDQNGTDDLEIFTGSATSKTVGVAKELGKDIFLKNGTSGLIVLHSNTARSWDEEKDYLYPIPTDDRNLTGGALTQNPGWTTPY